MANPLTALDSTRMSFFPQKESIATHAPCLVTTKSWAFPAIFAAVPTGIAVADFNHEFVLNPVRSRH
jgi:hypothetical protein